MKTITKLWIGIGILALLSPIGLYLPEKLNAGAAWGEWSINEISKLTGTIPAGMKKLSSFWNAIFPDYNFKNWQNKGYIHQGVAYIISAFAGIIVCMIIAFIIGKFITSKKS